MLIALVGKKKSYLWEFGLDVDVKGMIKSDL